MKKHRCPICGGENFHVTAHVTQTWLVDTEGAFVAEISSCDEVTHKPDDEDIWACANENCGWTGPGYEAIKEE